MNFSGYKEAWRVAWPLLLSQASLVVMQFCDRVMLSRYGNAEIEAALPGGLLAFSFICFFQALASYAGTFSAQSLGAVDRRGALREAAQGIWLSFFSWPLMLALIPAGNFALSLGGHPPEVLALERQYLSIMLIGSLATVLNASLGAWFTAALRTRVNFVVNLFGCSLNILLNWVFIFGKFGLPACGIAGAGWATVVSQGVCVLCYSLLFAREKGVSLATLAPSRTIIAAIVRYGAPNGVKMLLDVSTWAIFCILAGHYGEAALAANNIALTINNLAFEPLYGFGLAASTLVARHQGERNSPEAFAAGNRCLVIGLLYMTLVGATFLLFPRAYFSLFFSHSHTVSPAEVLAVGVPMMICLAAWGVFDAANIILEHALNGAGDTRFVMWYVLAMNWLLFVPVALLLTAKVPNILYLWTWCAAYVVVNSAGLWVRWKGDKWRAIHLVP